MVDNFKGAYEATEHLVKNNYQNIANIAGSEYLSITKERLRGYRQALIDNGRIFDPLYTQHCLHGGMIYEEVEKALDQLLQLKKKPDAILGCADKLTTNCLRYFKKRKIKVPDNIALVGFSNLDLTDMLSPSLTVVRQPAFEMGQYSTELLVQLIESKLPLKNFERRILPTQLFIRESSMKAKSESKS
jgi:LacI family transcriptional regulator